jgi:putative transposase
MVTFRRKRNRLDLEVYKGSDAYFVTAATWQRRPAFLSKEIVEHCLLILRECAKQHSMRVLAYCFMPDHLHLLLVSEGTAPLVDFMRAFKHRSGYHCKKLLGWDGSFWQKSYYDHVVRSEERLETVAAYVWANPVRAGLVEDAEDYAFSGSLSMEREEVEG